MLKDRKGPCFSKRESWGRKRDGVLEELGEWGARQERRRLRESCHIVWKRHIPRCFGEPRMTGEDKAVTGAGVGMWVPL